jgi:hypothetical protein
MGKWFIKQKNNFRDVYMKRILVLPVLILLSTVAIFAQPKAANSGWVRIEGFMREYSFLMPEGYFAYRNKKTGETYLSSYKDDVSINIHIAGSLSPKEYLKGLEDKYNSRDCKYDYYTLGPYSGKFFTCENSKQFSKTIYLASGSGYFKIVVGALSEFEKDVTKFLGSLRFHGVLLFPKSNAASGGGDENAVEIFNVKNDPLVETYLNKPDNQNIKWGNSGNLKTSFFDADSTVYSRELIILRRKTPKFSFIRGGASVLVKVKIHFLTSGQVEKVEILSSTGAGHTEKVIESLKEMKFIPAQIDGKDVDCSRVMQFGFDTL